MAGGVVEILQVVKEDEVLNCLAILYMSCMKLCALKHDGNIVFKKLQNVHSILYGN
jgi:hypothetical protein